MTPRTPRGAITDADLGASNEPAFRTIEKRDEPAVAQLLDDAFAGNWPAAPISVPALEHLRWRLDSPRVVGGASTVLELDGRIVAYDGSIGRDVWVPGERRTGCNMVDSAVHPDYQGQGLSKLHLQHYLARWVEVEQPVQLDEGSNNSRLNKSSGPGSERMRRANAVEVPSRPLAVSAVVKRALSAPSASSALLLRPSLPFRSKHRAASRISVRPVDSFDGRSNSLWERVRVDFDYCVVRDREYLNWRYCDRRGGTYRARIAERDRELVGYSVLSPPSADVKVVNLFVASGDEAALRSLAGDAVSVGRGESASAVSIQMPRIHRYRETLRRLGFSTSMSVSNIGNRPRNDSLLDFLSEDPAARIHVAYGDSDHV